MRDAPPRPAEHAPTHFIARLGIRNGRTTDGQATATLRLGHDRPLDAGLLVLLADVVAGHAALVAGRPCGLSTTDISVHGWSGLRGPGDLVATATVLTCSRQRACVGVAFSAPATGGPAAAGMATFRLFPGAMDIGDPSTWDVPELADDPPALTASLADHVGVVVDDDGASIDLRPDVANHVGSLQGGATAALLESAAGLAPGAADSITVTYLAQGRRGPFRAQATAAAPATTAVAVTAVDLGADHRPVAHAVLGVPART